MQKLFGVINKSLGGNTVQFLTKDFKQEIKSFSTGSLTLDLALGLGGLPRGRIIEVFGPSMAGKTTLCMLYLAEVQRADEGYTVFVDAEHAFNTKLAIEYGIDLDKLIYVNAQTAENAIDTIESLVRSGQVRAIVVDSVSALTPSKVAESSMEQNTIALLARLMSTAMQKLNGPVYNHDTTLVFINQLREKPGGFSPGPGTPTTTSGGRALPFYSSVRLNVRMGDYIKEKDEIIGHIMKVKVVKNKVGVPFKEASFSLIYGKGVDRVDEVSQIAVLAGIVEQAGAWFRYRDEDGNILVRDEVEYRWQGRASMVEFIRHNPLFLVELENKLRGIEVEAPKGAPVNEDGYLEEETK
jgi:recombination protein RecA